MKQAIMVSSRRYGGQALTLHSSTATMTLLGTVVSTGETNDLVTSVYVINDIIANDYVTMDYSVAALICIEVN